jgi:iron complex outermembrane recepter protein
MFKRTKINTGALLALGGALLLPAVSQAQDSQRIEVTGSRIKRVDAETASPVQVISKEDIEQSGKGTVAEYLQTLTADGQGSVPFTYGRGFSGATASGISLRGLGANATLVLINGRRVATSVLADDFQRSFVDLNQIPLEAVERVEVLKDGASSIYGSDAVAGVVNIILRKSFNGTAVKVTYGVAQEGDGKEPRAAITHGFGDLAKDGYNVLLNAELGKRDSIYYRDRVGRGPVGVSAIGQAPWGFDPNTSSNNTGRVGGNGWIPVDGTGARLVNGQTPSIVGNVRNPDGSNLFYSRSDLAGVGFTQTFAGAGTFCNANVNLPQNNPAGGCILDLRQAVNQIQPEQTTGNFSGRATVRINNDVEAFGEVAYYGTKSRVDGLPISSNAGYNTITGAVSRASVALIGADHPDNPYLGTAARLSYLPLFDPGVGVSGTDSKSHSARFLAGVRGVYGAWDFDTAVSFSESKQTDTSTKNMDRRVLTALLNPTAANVAAATAFSPAYAALPPGTVWRIGENAGLNSPELYRALLADKSRDGFSRQYGIDLKVSREFGKLEGGAIGAAFGVEARHEATDLGLYDGLGDFIGLSLTSYAGKRDIRAAFAEVLLPVLKQLEVNAALRVDHYSDAGSSWTPKVGVKWTPLNNLALRGTVARGFRAPSFPEVSPKVVATFGGTTINDEARCAAGVDASTCRGISPTFAATGNPDLKPEKSQSLTLGMVWDVTPKTSLTADVWQIKRKGLPVTGDGQAAVDAGNVLRDPTTAQTPTDPGALVNVFVGYENSDESLTRGLDIEAKHNWDLGGGMGRLTGTFNWSHLFTQRVIAQNGIVHDYAGTHGDCNITNCIGSPKDKISIAATWDMEQFRLGANINYRGSMKNTFEQFDTDPDTRERTPTTCAQTRADGSDFPPGCKVKSFTTLDISGAWKFGKNTELFGSIANLFDTKPPADFETYGAIGYNPLDYSGAIGRFFRIGLKHKF